MRKKNVALIGYQALSDTDSLRRCTNADYLEFLRSCVWSKLTDEQRELYVKLLSTDRSRYLAMPTMGEFVSGTHESRYSGYKTCVEALSKEVAERLLVTTGVDPARIGLIISNSSVGGICPPVSSVVAGHLKLGSRIRSLDLCYMGCAASLYAVDLAAQLLEPGKCALVVSVEVTSAMTNLTGVPSSLVANCVFGDGASALLVGVPPYAAPPRFEVKSRAGSLITDQAGLSCIRYLPNPVFHEIHLADSIPEVALRGIHDCIEPIVRQSLTSPLEKLMYVLFRRTPDWKRRVQRFVLHTAGTKVLEGIRDRLKLDSAQVDHNFRAFARHGNTSSTSVIYSLAELEAKERLQPGTTVLLLAFGSGFMTQGLLAKAA